MFWPDDLTFARGEIIWFLTSPIKVRLIPRRKAKPWLSDRTNRFWESMGYLAMCLSKLGGEIEIDVDDLRFESSRRIGYLMVRKGEAFEVTLAHDRDQITVVGAQTARPREIVVPKEFITPTAVLQRK